MRARKKQATQGPVEGKWDLPAGWEWKRLGEVCSYIQRGKSPKYTDNSGIPVINQKCIRWDALQIEYAKYTLQSSLSDEFRFVRPGDILWNSTGTGTIGRAYCVRHIAKSFVVDSHVTILRCSNNISASFLYYFIMSPFVQRKIEDMQSGSTNQVELSKAAICDLAIPLPPTVQDQERIVERIDRLFAELDKAEETLRHTITLCEQYKQSVLKAAVTGELSKEWRKANPPTETGKQLLQRILKERRTAWEKAELAKMTAKGQKPANDNWKKKYKEPQAPDTSGLPELPEGWTWATFPQLGEFGRGKSKHRPRDDARLYGGDYPFLQTGTVRASNGMITTYDNTYSDFGLAQSKLWPKGTVCITIAANIANSGILTFSACFPDSIVGLVPHSDINVHYIECFIRTAQKNLDRYAPATAQKNINLEILESVAIPMPPKDEQFFLAKLLEQHLEDVNDTKELCQKERLRCAALRQSILKQAFTGQLT